MFVDDGSIVLGVVEVRFFCVCEIEEPIHC